MAQSKVLITGGLGHIGSGLFPILSKTHNVTVVDNLMTQRFCSLFGNASKIEFLDQSFETIEVKELKKYSHIIHLAAITDAASSFENKQILEKVNIEQTKILIEKTKAANNPHFIFPSSTSIYGAAREEVIESDHAAIVPQSPYAESKITIEKHLHQSGVRYTILRLGTIFGVSPGIRFHTAINKFCYQATFGKPLSVWKQNLKQIRPYLGLQDVYKGFEIVLKKPETIGQTYNVLTENYSLEEIISMIQREMPVEVDLIDSPLLNQFSYMVNFDKFKKLGFKPREKLESVISDTIRLLKGEG